jgi:GAF domain-containing protein
MWWPAIASVYPPCYPSDRSLNAVGHSGKSHIERIGHMTVTGDRCFAQRQRGPGRRHGGVWSAQHTGNAEGMSALPSHDLAVRMADLARTIARDQTLDAVLVEVTAAAVELLPGVDTAGILLVKPGGGFDSMATTSDLPHQLDILQMTFEEGPCVQAASADTIVRTDDFREETRWPKYSPAVVEVGVLSGMSFKLYTGDRTAGALNLFGFQPRTWDTDAETVGSVLAAHAAAAIIATQEEGHLRAALLTRDRIGQAKGIIMERFGVDDVRAFQMLRQLSQEENIKLVEIAGRVIDTRGT